MAWLAEADLVVHETGFGIHTPLERLAALPAALRAKMRLAHFPDQVDLGASASSRSSRAAGTPCEP